MILILIPSHYEAKVFISGLTGRKKYRAGKADMVEGRAGHTHVITGIIGMGPPQAARRTQAVLEEARRRHPQAVRGVILCGFAGALKPGLRRGEIFLTAGAEFILPHLPEAERPTLAVLHTAEKVAATAAAARAHERVAGGHGAGTSGASGGASGAAVCRAADRERRGARRTAARFAQPVL
jgi:nucleoside phosphorylase